VFSSLRISLGDFDFSGSTYLNQSENYMFWIIWFLVVIVTCVIFLNFIIAEASASYSKVTENLKAMMAKERASLISDAENLIFNRLMDDKRFPRFIIIREIQT